MALCFVLDENLRGALWQAIRQHNAAGIDVLDCLCVGHSPAPPPGTLDPDLLLWIEAHGRILVCLDKNMIGMHLAPLRQAGHHIPGLFLIRTPTTIPDRIAALILADFCHEPPDFIDQVVFTP